MAGIDIEDAGLEIHGRTIFSGVSLRLDAAEPVVIIGPSGAGKTSLLRAIMGLHPVTSGQVIVDGVAIHHLKDIERASCFAWLPQQPAVAHGMAVIDYLMGSRFRFREPRRTSREKILEALAVCDIAGFADRAVRRLSGGELQRVLLAGCFAQEARWLLLDEPANHLDPGLTRALMQMVADRHKGGLGLLLVTHHLNMLGPLQRMSGLPVRVIGLRRGEVELDAHSDQDLSGPLSRLYDFPMQSLTVNGSFHYVPGPS